MNLVDHCIMSGSGSPAASLVGRFLVAAPSMPDERFQKSVVFICKHDDDGALGIIVNNKVEDLPLGQVYKQLGIAVSPAAAERAVLFGGPVETSRGLVLHSADYKREETLLIDGGMALTASLEILKDMAGGSGPKEAWLALGHSGWAPGQLDLEMQDNAWLVVDGDAALVFDVDFAAKWQRALDRLGSKGGPGGRFDPASFSHQWARLEGARDQSRCCPPFKGNADLAELLRMDSCYSARPLQAGSVAPSRRPRAPWPSRVLVLDVAEAAHRLRQRRDLGGKRVVVLVEVANTSRWWLGIRDQAAHPVLHCNRRCRTAQPFNEGVAERQHRAPYSLFLARRSRVALGRAGARWNVSVSLRTARRASSGIRRRYRGGRLHVNRPGHQRKSDLATASARPERPRTLLLRAATVDEGAVALGSLFW